MKLAAKAGMISWGWEGTFQESAMGRRDKQKKQQKKPKKHSLKEKRRLKAEKRQTRDIG